MTGADDEAALRRAAADSQLNEDEALALLARRDLPAAAVEELARNPTIARLRTVRYALITHLRAPRHVALPLLRHLYPFELMKLALLPQLASDLKRTAEDSLIAKAATLSSGERLALAKQGSSRLAAELLRDVEPRVTSAALENPRLTEEGVVRALLHPRVPAHLAPMVCHDRKWRLRPEVRMAALRCEFTPLAHAIDFAAKLPLAQLTDILAQSKLAEQTKEYLLRTAARRAR